METNKVNCYLCGSEATKKKRVGTLIPFSCPECTEYCITVEAIHEFFNRKDEQVLLDEQDKKKLSEYVKNSYKETGEEHIIQLVDIEARTGKKPPRKPPLPPYKERTPLQHIGRFIEVIGAICGVIGLIGVIGFISQGTQGNWVFRRLLISLALAVGGILTVGLGEMIYSRQKKKKSLSLKED